MDGDTFANCGAVSDDCGGDFTGEFEVLGGSGDDGAGVDGDVFTDACAIHDCDV